MPSHSLLARLDVLHPQARHRDVLSKRMLYGSVFGQEIPAWIIFHAMLGYALLGVGMVAIFLRIPVKVISRRRWLHPYLGYTWIFGTVWMAVTSIWCVHSFVGWDIVAYFIFSMYAAIQLGWLSIRTYKASQDKSELVTTNEQSKTQIWKLRVWLILHAVAMIYSFIMLLGAGISFPFRTYTNYAT